MKGGFNVGKEMMGVSFGREMMIGNMSIGFVWWEEREGRVMEFGKPF